MLPYTIAELGVGVEHGTKWQRHGLRFFREYSVIDDQCIVPSDGCMLSVQNPDYLEGMFCCSLDRIA